MDASGSLCEKMLVYGETPSNNCIRIELKNIRKGDERIVPFGKKMFAKS